MDSDSRERLGETLQAILNASLDNKRLLAELLQAGLQKFIELVKKNLKRNPVIPLREVKLAFPTETDDIQFRVKRTATELRFNCRFLELPKMERENFLYFLLAKESLMHFIDSSKQFPDFCEVVFNIIATLILRNHLRIRTLDNHVITAIRSRFFYKEIAGKSHLFWDTLLLLLFRRKVSPSSIFDEFHRLVSTTAKNAQSIEKLTNDYYKWVVEQTIKEEDVIAPFYLTERHKKIVNYLLELGFEGGTAKKIAGLMNLHGKTIRREFSELAARFAIYWSPKFNLQLLNLYSYLLKITLPSRKEAQELEKTLLKISYLKELYEGTDTNNSPVLYSSTLDCPHLISNKLSELLTKLQSEGRISSYTLQRIRSRIRFSGITTELFIPTTKNFRKLIMTEETPATFQKLVLRNDQIDSSMEFDDRLPALDYNLLYFLAIFKCRYLIKSRYGVWVDQFYALCKENDIQHSDTAAVMNLINQLEIRARKKGLVSYSLHISSGSFFNDSLILELPVDSPSSEKELERIIDRIKVFSFQGLLKLYDRWLFALPGISHKHPVARLLKQVIEQEGFTATLYTLRSKNFRFVPLQKLFDYETKKWNAS